MTCNKAYSLVESGEVGVIVHGVCFRPLDLQDAPEFCSCLDFFLNCF